MNILLKRVQAVRDCLEEQLYAYSDKDFAPSRSAAFIQAVDLAYSCIQDRLYNKRGYISFLEISGELEACFKIRMHDMVLKNERDAAWYSRYIDAYYSMRAELQKRL